ncbi:MAG: hypothetical protein LQ338_002651 [Usnochroma carphineum]|nr:MAG: hypothetical protein LQ338_002651 [Usnochroma carphineum]
MDNLDGSDHYSKTTDEPPPSLLTIILDTHPSAWALLASTLPFSKALAALLIFINAHLACNNSNQVCVIAAHPHRAEFLYPSPSPSSSVSPEDRQQQNGTTTPSASEANFYRPFRLIQTTLLNSLYHLLSPAANPPTLPSTPSVALSGALTLALTYTNRLLTSFSTTTITDPSTSSSNSGNPHLSSRILLLSITGSLSPQYIPLTNTIFACQRLSIPIDVAKLAGDAVFLEQASDATRGTYLQVEHPRGLLQYLMMAFLPDQVSRRWLRSPGKVGVDFRAAFFCSPPEDAVCLTCGTQLKLGNYGQKPVVVARKKKKRKTKLNGDGDIGSGAATPVH